MKEHKKIALVTGANRGIGYAVAKGLLQKGITTIATSRNAKTAKEFTQRLERFGELVYHPLDVTDNQSIEKCVQFIKSDFDRLDILVNNAGINYDTWQNVQNANLQEVRRTLETNTIAPWNLIQSFLPLLKKSENANIVNVSSGAGSWNSQNGNTPGYSLSKLALNGLTVQFAKSLRNTNIKVNAVCPGWVRTDMGGSGATKSPEQGAETIIWAALFDKHSPTGKFFRDKKEISF